MCPEDDRKPACGAFSISHREHAAVTLSMEDVQRSTSNSAAPGCGAADSAVAGSGATHRNLRQVWGPQAQLEGADGAAAQQGESGAAEVAAAGGCASCEGTAEDLTATGCASGRGGDTDAEDRAAAAAAVRATAEDESHEAEESATAPRQVFSDRRETRWSPGRGMCDQQGCAADRGVEYGERLAAPAPHADMQLQDPEGQHRRRRSTVQIIQKKEKECYCVTEVDYIPRYWTTDLMCCFATRPQYILLIKRINSPLVTRQAAELATFLATELNFTVLVEPAAAEEMAKATSHAVPLKTWSLDGAAARASRRTSPAVQCAAAEAASQREARAGGAAAVQPTQEVFDSDSLALGGQRPQHCGGAAAAWDLHGRAKVFRGASASAVADEDLPCYTAFASATTVAARPVDGAADAVTPSSRLAAAAVSATKNAAVRRTAVIGGHAYSRGASSPSSTSAVHRNTAGSAAPSEEQWQALSSAAVAAPLQTQRGEHNVVEAAGPGEEQTPQLPTDSASPFRSSSAEEQAISSGSTDTVPAGHISSAAESAKHLTPLPGAARVHVAQQLLPLHSAAAAAAAAGGAAETLTAPTTQSSSLPGSPLLKREAAATTRVQSMASVASSSCASAAPFSKMAVSPAAAASASADPSPGRTSRALISKAEENSPSRHARESSQVPAMLCDSIDLVVALGGDGTMLWVSQLFAESVPPVLGVAMGSLGYLTRFTLRAARRQLRAMAACKRFSVNLRCRLKITLTSKAGAVLETFVAFNDCVIDRGHSSNLCTLDVFCNGAFFTTVAADGLILATPTGSTAYSMSAGGSMVHPKSLRVTSLPLLLSSCVNFHADTKVPCLLFTPICPHTLSFRPVILPDSVELRIVVPEDARGSVWIAVDGRSRTQVEKGMQVLVSLSAFPFPMVTRSTPSSQDVWLESLKTTLNWNCRVRQGEGPAADVEKQQGRTAAPSSASSSSSSPSSSSSSASSSSSSASSSSSSATSVTRSARRSRGSSTSDSNDGDGGTSDKKDRRDRWCSRSNSSSKRSSKGGAGGSGRGRKTCESCRNCGHCRRNRSSSGSRSSMGGGGYGRNRKKQDILQVASTSCKTSAEGPDGEIAGPAEEEEAWEEDGIDSSNFTRSQSVAAAIHKSPSSSVSPTVLRPPRCFRRGMQRRSVQRGGSNSSRHRKSSSPRSNDSQSSSSNRRSSSSNEKDGGSTDGYGVGRSPGSNRRMRKSHSRKWKRICERASILHRGEKIDDQEHRASSRHANARHLAAAGRRTAAAAEEEEEDGRRAARGRPWIGAATVGARECQPAQQQRRGEMSKPGPPAVRARRRTSYVQGGERKNLSQQRPGSQDQIFSTVLSGRSAARPPLAALHCLSRNPAGNAAAAVAAAAPAVAAVAAVSSSPEASGAPARRRLPATATFISLPAAAAAAARAEEQQAAGVAEQPMHSTKSPLHKQIFVCDEQLVLPGERTLLKCAAADDAAPGQETRQETRMQEAKSDTDVGEPWFQPQQLVLPTEADGLSSEALVSDSAGAHEPQSRLQQQYPQQQPHVQQHQHEEQQQAQREGERQGQRTARTVCEEPRQERGSTRAGDATKIVTAVTPTAAGEWEGRTASVPVSALLRYPEGCMAAAAAAVSTPACASRSSSAHHRRSPRTAATIGGRSTAEGHSRSPKRSDDISFAAVEHRKKEKRRYASSEKQRRSISSDWPSRRQQRALPRTHPLQPCWTLRRVYTVKSWLPSWSPLPSEAEGAGETAAAAGGGTAAEEASLLGKEEAAAGQSLAAELPEELGGRARGRRAARVGRNGGATAATEALVLMHKTPGSADTAIDTVYVSPCVRSNRASADLSEGFRSMGFISSGPRGEGSTSRWKACRSKRGATKILLESEKNNTAAHSRITDSYRRGTGRHQEGVNAGVAGASVVSTRPSRTQLQRAHPHSGAQSVLLSDLGERLFARRGEPVDGRVLATMSRLSPPVGCSFPAALPEHAATIQEHLSLSAAAEHSLAAAPAAVCDRAAIGTECAAADGGGTGEGAALRTAHTRDKASRDQQVQHRRNNLEAGACLGGETSLHEPCTTGSVRQEEGSGRGRGSRAQAEAPDGGQPATAALPAKNTAGRDRAAAASRRTRGTGEDYSERKSPGRSRGANNSMHSTFASTRAESAVKSTHASSRVAALRKCFQIDRRTGACRFLRLRRRYSGAAVHAAILLLLKRNIFAITQGYRSVGRPAVSPTAELTTAPPPPRGSPLSCLAFAATRGAGDSDAVSRFTSAAAAQRCSHAVTGCCCGGGPSSSKSLVNTGANPHEFERERQSIEESAANEVVAESRNGNCRAWQAAEAPFSGLEQTERCARGGVSEADLLPLYTSGTGRSAGDERKISLLGRRTDHLHTDRNTHWEQERSKRAAVYVHRGGLSNTCAGFVGSKESSAVFPEQSHRRRSTVQSFSCDDAQDEQQTNLQREQGTHKKRTGMRQESGRFTQQGRGAALLKDNGEERWPKNENGLQPKEQRGLGQKETKSHDPSVAPGQEEQQQHQHPLQPADARACTREEGVLREVGGQAGSIAGLTNEAAGGSPADDSSGRADTVAVQQQRVGDGRRDFQETQQASRATTIAGAQAGVLAEDATGNVSDDAFVTDSTAPPSRSREVENSILSGQKTRRLTGTTRLNNAASAACAATSRAVGETASRTGTSRARSEEAGGTPAEEAGSTLSLNTGAAGASDGAASWKLSSENASPIIAADSCSNSPPRASKAQLKPVHAPNVVGSSSGKRGDCDSTMVFRAALGAALPQAVFKRLPYVGHKPAKARKEEEALCDVDSNHSASGRLSGNCSTSETSDSSCSRASDRDHDCSGPKQNSSVELVSGSEGTTDRKSFPCCSGCGKARYLSVMGVSEQAVRPGTRGNPSTIPALSELLVGKQEGPQKDSHECGAASDTSVFRMGYRLAEAGNEVPLPQPKGESSDTPGSASGESSPRSLTYASLALHPPEPPIFPAHDLRAHLPSSAGSASASAASSPCSGQKKSTCTSGYAGAQREQHYTDQTNTPTAVAVDVSLSWPQHREQQLEHTDEPRPSSHISVQVTRTTEPPYAPQSSRAEQVEKIEGADFVGVPVYSRERVMQRRNTRADDTPQENSEDAAARCEKRSSFRRCAFSAATLVSDAEAAAEDDEEPRRRDMSLRGDKLKNSRTSSSLRPSRSVVGITHSTERTTRSLAQSTSVFMLPTDRCTAVVRLVSSASRTSLELFRDVREVTAASASASLSCPVDETKPTRRTLQHT